MKGIQMANVGTKNQKRGGVPFVNVAVPVEDREKLRQIALQEDSNIGKHSKNGGHLVLLTESLDEGVHLIKW